MSHCCFVYLADDISGLLERVSAIAVSLMHPHQKNLKSRGLKFNKEKESMQVGEWLGFVIDTISILRNSPSLRRSNLNSIILSRSVTVRVPARVAGFIIISLLLAAVPIAVDSFHYPRAVWLWYIVRFRSLVLCWRSCVFGFILSTPLMVTGLSQSSPPEQFFFSATKAITLLALPSSVERSSCPVILSSRKPAKFEFLGAQDHFLY